MLENARQIARPSLVTATLQTLLKFLNWIPLMYVFNTNIIDQLVNVFFPVRHRRLTLPAASRLMCCQIAHSSWLWPAQYAQEPQFRNDALKCLTEIAGLDPRDIGERCDTVSAAAPPCRCCWAFVPWPGCCCCRARLLPLPARLGSSPEWPPCRSLTDCPAGLFLVPQV